MRNLEALRKLGQEHDSPKTLVPASCGDIRELDLQHLPYLTPSSRLDTMTDDEVVQEAIKARNWLFGILDCHEVALDREREIRMFRAIVEKEMASDGGESSVTDMERLYMALTDYTLASPEERLQAAFALVLQRNFAERLKDVGERAAICSDRMYRASAMNAAVDETREKIAEKASLIIVDHFACATPLSSLAPSVNPSVIDDNAGCCSICHSSYTALGSFPIAELLADFPVRIKYCGHIIGKACLEQWMTTPKIQEAKFPHRSCPMCRMKLEGVRSPRVPHGLFDWLKGDRRAMETVKELVYGWDMDMGECLNMVMRTMSEEIACEELMGEVKRMRSQSGDDRAFEKEAVFLKEKMEELRKEKWVLGFRGDGVWRKLRDEWMKMGVVRKD